MGGGYIGGRWSLIRLAVLLQNAAHMPSHHARCWLHTIDDLVTDVLSVNQQSSSAYWYGNKSTVLHIIPPPATSGPVDPQLAGPAMSRLVGEGQQSTEKKKKEKMWLLTVPGPLPIGNVPAPTLISPLVGLYS